MTQLQSGSQLTALTQVRSPEQLVVRDDGGSVQFEEGPQVASPGGQHIRPTDLNAEIERWNPVVKGLNLPKADKQ